MLKRKITVEDAYLMGTKIFAESKPEQIAAYENYFNLECTDIMFIFTLGAYGLALCDAFISAIKEVKVEKLKV